MLDVIKEITDDNTFKHIDPIKQTNNILIFIKYEYLSRGGDPNQELYDIKTSEHTTLKQIKEELNKSFIYGELEPEQYEIYTGEEQQNIERRNSEPQTFYYTYTEPQLLDDDDKTLKDYNIKDGQLLYLKAKLKILLHVPCCRFTTIYLYTYNTLEDIQKEAIKIFNKGTNREFKPEQITAFYSDTELEEDEQISTYIIYNYSTITTDINYNRR